jgi:ribonuclease J
VLAEEGVVVAVVTIDTRSGEIVGTPEIVSRGFLDEPGAEPVVEELRSALVKAIEVAAGEGSLEADSLRRVMRRTVGRIVSDRTRRRPMIVPVVLEA